MKKLISIILQEVFKDVFKNQSNFKSNLIDLFHSFFLKKNFEIIKGNINIDGISYQENKSKSRSFTKDKISSFYIEKSAPDYILPVINDNKKAIQDYLGTNFKIKHSYYNRTYNIPDYLETYDVYSNIWHLDSHDGFKLLKIFVLLHDTSDDDGPFYFLERKDTIKYWNKLKDRYSGFKQNIENKIMKFDEEKKFTGKKGDYLIINTSTCMHRASIPKNHRDMVQILIYPEWNRK